MHEGFCGNLSRSETSNSVAYVTSSSDYVPSVCSICAFCFADSQPPDASGLSGWMRDPDRSVRMLWAPQFLAQQGTRTPRVRMARDRCCPGRAFCFCILIREPTTFLQLQELCTHNTTRTSSGSTDLLFTPSSSLRSATSSPRPQPLRINHNIDGAPLASRAHSPLPLTNLSPPPRFPLLRYPLPPLHLVCARLCHPPVSALCHSQHRPTKLLRDKLKKMAIVRRARTHTCTHTHVF